MRYITFCEPERKTYRFVVLVPGLDRKAIQDAYITPAGLDPKDVLAIELMTTGKKTPVKEMKRFLDEEIYPALSHIQAEYLIVGDANYFKVLSGETKADMNIGYVCKTPHGQNCVYVPNFKSIFYDPAPVKAKIKQSMNALLDHQTGDYTAPGSSIIKFAAYPQTVQEIRAWLDRLYQMDVDLTADIEAFSLRHTEAGIGTISFAWNQGEGIAFPVDLLPHPIDRQIVRGMLRTFFTHFKRKMIWHNISYDVYVLIYQLFMDNLIDTSGLLDGLEIMMRNFDDTKIITYLATNSCAGNTLGLKDNAQEFAGNYAVEDIKDITKIPLADLLQYNLVDTLSTWYVRNKYYDRMVNDQQLDIYENLMKPALLDIIQMQLTGLPIDLKEVAEARAMMEKERDRAVGVIRMINYIGAFEYHQKEKLVAKKNASYKKKVISISDISDSEIALNLNSPNQLQELLYEYLNLPVLDRTDSKQPATGRKSLKKLKAHTDDPLIKELLDAIIDFKDVDKILTGFIPAFEAATLGPDGQYYLFGFFNLGGTVSGRLSSNGPNLQNLPASGSRYAKIIKKCFRAIKGYLFVGLDFASLEDRISALTTKDPQKLKVYTDGYDGHAMRAVAYFGDQMPDIDPNSVESVNSIAEKGHKYGHFRQDSKVPTFLLTYGGTWIGIMEQCGFSKEKAQSIEANYHKLYTVSDQWVSDKLDQASKVGYVTVAFGLRVRTPLLHQVIRGNKATPFEAEAEGRTAGNALGQSYGLLNTRAASAFMKKVRAHPEYRLMIRPCAQIHDAQYYLIPDNINCLFWMNKHLVEEVKWQDDPAIYHPEVKLGGELSIFYPSWAEELSLPNNLNHEIFQDKLNAHLEKYCPQAA